MVFRLNKNIFYPSREVIADKIRLGPKRLSAREIMSFLVQQWTFSMDAQKEDYMFCKHIFKENLLYQVILSSNPNWNAVWATRSVFVEDEFCKEHQKYEPVITFVDFEQYLGAHNYNRGISFAAELVKRGILSQQEKDTYDIRGWDNMRSLAATMDEIRIDVLALD